MTVEERTREVHPLTLFAPEGARLLMLGSFPPPRERWRMDFFYPNFQNDMWRIFFAQLLGMSDNISFNLAHAGYNVTKYVPYAKVRDVLPYLLRRAEENTSVAGQTTRELNMLNLETERRKRAK